MFERLSIRINSHSLLLCMSIFSLAPLHSNENQVEPFIPPSSLVSDIKNTLNIQGVASEHSFLNCLRQYFSKLNVHLKALDLVKVQLLIPQTWEAREPLLVSSSRVVPGLLVHGPHPEEQGHSAPTLGY